MLETKEVLKNTRHSSERPPYVPLRGFFRITLRFNKANHQLSFPLYIALSCILLFWCIGLEY